MLIIGRRQRERVVLFDRSGVQIGSVAVAGYKNGEFVLAFDCRPDVKVMREELLVQRDESGKEGSLNGRK